MENWVAEGGCWVVSSTVFTVVVSTSAFFIVSATVFSTVSSPGWTEGCLEEDCCSLVPLAVFSSSTEDCLRQLGSFASWQLGSLAAWQGSLVKTLSSRHCCHNSDIKTRPSKQGRQNMVIKILPWPSVRIRAYVGSIKLAKVLPPLLP